MCATCRAPTRPASDWLPRSEHEREQRQPRLHRGRDRLDAVTSVVLAISPLLDAPRLASALAFFEQHASAAHFAGSASKASNAASRTTREFVLRDAQHGPRRRSAVARILRLARGHDVGRDRRERRFAAREAQVDLLSVGGTAPKRPRSSPAVIDRIGAGVTHAQGSRRPRRARGRRRDRGRFRRARTATIARRSSWSLGTRLASNATRDRGVDARTCACSRDARVTSQIVAGGLDLVRFGPCRRRSRRFTCASARGETIVARSRPTSCPSEPQDPRDRRGAVAARVARRAVRTLRVRSRSRRCSPCSRCRDVRALAGVARKNATARQPPRVKSGRSRARPDVTAFQTVATAMKTGLPLLAFVLAGVASQSLAAEFGRAARCASVAAPRAALAGASARRSPVSRRVCSRTCCSRARRSACRSSPSASAICRDPANGSRFR